MTPSLSVTVCTTVEQLPAGALQLLTDAEVRGTSLGPAWYVNLQQTVFPYDNGLRYYTLQRGDSCVAVLPLRAQRRRGGWQLSALGNFYTTLYEPTLAHGLPPAELLLLLQTIRHDFPSLAALNFKPMDPGLPGYQILLAALRLAGMPAFEYFAFGNWYLRVPPSWGDYYKSLNSQMRNTLKRMGKKFAAAGGTIKIATKPDELVWAIAAYEQVYSASWKQEEPFPRFMPGMLSTFAAKGWLRLGVAWLEGQPVAAQAWIVAHGRAEIYKLAYDDAFKSYSPGSLLSSTMMQYAFEVDHISEADYLIGDDPYKKTWMSDRRERWGIVAYNPRSLSGLLGLLQEVFGRLSKPPIRKFKALWDRRKAPT